jgi:cell division protein FtsQ
LRIALLSGLLALPLLGGSWLWIRSSPLVAVEHVRFSGIHGPEAHAIESALATAARRMSTLEVRPGALRVAAAPFRVVREVRVTSSFPHGLHIHVLEQLPVAALAVNGARTAVAADGVVLGPALLSSSLPSLAGALLLAPGAHVRDADLLASLTVLGAAPAPLADLVARAFTGPRGLTVAMRDGLFVYFGDATRPHAKWLSLARVLADTSSAGATYVDVRLPSRPAAGFANGVTPSATGPIPATSSTAEQNASSESTVAALASGLAAANGGGTTASTGAGSTSASSPEASASSEASAAPEASSAPTHPAPTTPEQPTAAPVVEATHSAATPGG